VKFVLRGILITFTVNLYLFILGR